MTSPRSSLSGRQQDLIVRAAQSHLIAQGANLGSNGAHRDGVDGDPGPLTLAALEEWGDQVFPAVQEVDAPAGSPARYQQLWDTMKITGPGVAIDSMVKSIRAGRPRYETVSRATGVPWEVIGAIHALECSCNFKQHLHNGDPLSARTVRVPAGRPVDGKPPFAWETSAEDALEYDMLAGEENWSIAQTLRRLEAYNGPGYRKRGVNSPYLWSMTNHYVKGKFVADGKYDANAVSQQVGAAVLLRKLM